MRTRILVLVTLIIAPLALPADKKPQISQSPMDADQIAVYQTFLDSYTTGSKARINLSKITSTFSLAEEKKDSCLKGIAFDATGRTDSIVHEFDPKTALPGNIRLVDPREQQRSIKRNDPGSAIRQGQDVNSAVEAGFAAGLLTLSEVAFDKDRTHAAMSFSFVCGGLCGHGSTILLEKKDGKWRESKGRCSSWIS